MGIMYEKCHLFLKNYSVILADLDISYSAPYFALSAPITLTHHFELKLLCFKKLSVYLAKLQIVPGKDCVIFMFTFLVYNSILKSLEGVCMC